MNQDISKSGHPFEFLQEGSGDHPFFSQDLEYFPISIGFSTTPVGNDVAADVQEAFDGEVKITFGRGMDEHILLEGLDIKLANRLQGLEIVTKFFEPDGDEVFADHTQYLS